MRRRQQHRSDDAPTRLVHFDPADWGGGADAAVHWYAAWDAWVEEHPDMALWADSWPDVPWDPEAVG